MDPEKFSLQNRIKSFRHAIRGLQALFLAEHNARIHLLASLIAIILGFSMEISGFEWGLLSFAIATVFICELFNTAIEKTCDFISPEFHPAIKRIKDLSAAAVLLGALLSLIIGGIIFLPKLV
jgi:diacylglycerol kinase